MPKEPGTASRRPRVSHAGFSHHCHGHVTCCSSGILHAVPRLNISDIYSRYSRCLAEISKIMDCCGQSGFAATCEEKKRKSIASHSGNYYEAACSGNPYPIHAESGAAVLTQATGLNAKPSLMFLPR
eukprot:608938-Amorphochlora_amoeboformis.AAC.1